MLSMLNFKTRSTSFHANILISKDLGQDFQNPNLFKNGIHCLWYLIII
jgi:hypothetical protein